MILRYIKIAEDAVVPTQSHEGDAGYDLYACKPVVLMPGGRTRVHTGISIAIPPGYAGFVLPRSGLAERHGVTLTNSPGLIDCGYRGEVQVLLHNTDLHNDFQVAIGDRVGQLVIIKVELPEWQEVAELEDTPRGDAGFGSSGL